MMKKFNVLDRQTTLHQHYLLEASAGTGKTFSIQNIVVRLLIESREKTDPLPLSQILVVTFTRAATRDLRLRIRSNIEHALHSLNEWLNSKTISDTTPDYLKVIMEGGEECIQKAKKRLQQALFGFDQAQIFTIHSFCSRMLKQYAMESDMGFHATSGEATLPQSEILAVIRDFFRTEVRPENYSPAQLDIVLKEDPEQKKLLKTIKSGYDFEELPTFQQLYLQFVASMYELKQIYALRSCKMLADFQVQSPSYRNYKNGETKAETLAKITNFTALFNQEEWSIEDFDRLIQDGLVWTLALDPKLLKSRTSAPHPLHYPALTQELKRRLEPLVVQAGHFSFLLIRLARDCQKLLRRYQREEEKLSPDDLLRKMDWALDQAHFLKHIQSTYQAAIIDEFQDTDPLQWRIFKKLFIPDDQDWTGYLYLVGDPKQSIYSFRQADIYTYLAAAQALGEQHCYSLDVNYRSQPDLVNALNALFSSENTPRLIPLPKKDFYLPYQPVFTSPSNQNRHFQDEKGAVHFFIGDGRGLKRPKWQDLEDHVFFPFIVQEIRRLQEQKGFDFRQFATLVRDRHQALRLAAYFDVQQIPYLNQRGTSLAQSAALASFIDLIRAILHPHDRGAIRTALGTLLLGWNHEELKADGYLEPILAVIQHLREILIEKGFAFFFQEFLQSSWRMDGATVLEHLLSQKGGLEFYHDLQQIADITTDYRYREWNGPEGLIPFFDKFQLWQENDDERVKRFQDPSLDGVKILTLHFSKGLEFDIVFALGLAQRSGGRDELIPVERAGQLLLTPLLEECEEHHRFCEEADAEKMRQLYVAMTRAKYQLYIPVSLHCPTNHLKWGEASPIDLFLGRLGQPACSYGELYERIKQFDGKHFLEFMEKVGSKHHMSYSIHESLSLCTISKKMPACVDLKQPRSVEVTAPTLMMTSFSRLNHSPAAKPIVKAPPHDFNHPVKEVHTLPASSETGVLIHQLLEKLSFSDFRHLKSKQEALPLVRPFIQKAAFKEWEVALADLTYHIMHADLGIDQIPFSLAELESWEHYREMSFLFPYEPSLALEGLMKGNGFIKGVVDLIFVYQKRYYIIDWKSNWLGYSLEDYHQSHLHEAMLAHGYFTQAQIYTEALRRYLSLVEPRPFEACFGGALYLFLRGMQVGKQTGIYRIDPFQNSI